MISHEVYEGTISPDIMHMVTSLRAEKSPTMRKLILAFLTVNSEITLFSFVC